jgi:hypothetical protein
VKESIILEQHQPTKRLKKTCCRCKLEKPIDDFARSKKERDGKCSECRACRRELWLDYAAKQKAKSAFLEKNAGKCREQRIALQIYIDAGSFFWTVLKDGKPKNISGRGCRSAMAAFQEGISAFDLAIRT